MTGAGVATPRGHREIAVRKSGPFAGTRAILEDRRPSEKIQVATRTLYTIVGVELRNAGPRRQRDIARYPPAALGRILAQKDVFLVAPLIHSPSLQCRFFS